MIFLRRYIERDKEIYIYTHTHTLHIHSTVVRASIFITTVARRGERAKKRRNIEEFQKYHLLTNEITCTEEKRRQRSEREREEERKEDIDRHERERENNISIRIRRRREHTHILTTLTIHSIFWSYIERKD